MLSFIPFKSKEFIFLISLYSVKCKSKRYLSQLQTKVFTKKDNYTEYSKYTLNEKIHREDRDENGRVLPAITWSDGSDGTQEWVKNNKCH